MLGRPVPRATVWVLRAIALAAILGIPMMLSARSLAASWSVGKTSQNGVVRAYISNHRLESLILQLRTRCSDHRRRAIWPGFVPPFRHPQGSSGRFSDSYDIVGGGVGTGSRFRQRASFRARVAGNALVGSATVTQTFIPTGVVCRSPRVTFTVDL